MKNCILKDRYIIPNNLINEALSYAELSKAYTSNRHDFHSGGLRNKKIKMLEGKLGEKVFKMFLIDNKIDYIEDSSSYTEADTYDFIIANNLTVDVKTRTKSFHIRTLEMVEQFVKNPKDIYISARLYENKTSGTLLGWITKEDIIRINRIQNNGYLDNYVIYDNELRPMQTLIKYVTKS